MRDLFYRWQLITPTGEVIEVDPKEVPEVVLELLNDFSILEPIEQAAKLWASITGMRVSVTMKLTVTAEPSKGELKR